MSAGGPFSGVKRGLPLTPSSAESRMSRGYSYFAPWSQHCATGYLFYFCKCFSRGGIVIPRHTPSWRVTPCSLSATAYAVVVTHSQLLTISGCRLHCLQSEDPPIHWVVPRSLCLLKSVSHKIKAEVFRCLQWLNLPSYKNYSIFVSAHNAW
jgi:hypothetical protein